MSKGRRLERGQTIGTRSHRLHESPALVIWNGQGNGGGDHKNKRAERKVKARDGERDREPARASFLAPDGPRAPFFLVGGKRESSGALVWFGGGRE